MRLILLLFFIFLQSSSVTPTSSVSYVTTPNSYDNHENITLFSNKDTIGILKIPGINYEDYVVQTNNNTFYLNHDYNKKESIYGNAFLDYRVKLDNRQLNIYHHHFQNNNLGFASILKYQDKSFAVNNKDIFLETKNETLHYEVFASSFIAKTNNEHMQVLFGTTAEFIRHLDKLTTNALYKLSALDNIKQVLILQTCAYQNGDFLLLLAKRV